MYTNLLLITIFLLTINIIVSLKVKDAEHRKELHRYMMEKYAQIGNPLYPDLKYLEYVHRLQTEELLNDRFAEEDKFESLLEEQKDEYKLFFSGRRNVVKQAFKDEQNRKKNLFYEFILNWLTQYISQKVDFKVRKLWYSGDMGGRAEPKNLAQSDVLTRALESFKEIKNLHDVPIDQKLERMVVEVNFIRSLLSLPDLQLAQ